MTTETHTPGPWEACEPGDYSDFDGESRVVCSADPNDMRRIAVVHWSPRINTAESDANARLISAAPDLLEALKWIAENYENGHISHVDFRVEAKFLADAAINRAEGRS